MKKVFSILFASIVLLSGMHLTVASHICCGELAAVKYSFTGEKATCGMEDHQGPYSANGEVKSDCCKNNVASCTADSNYFPSSQEVIDHLSLTAPIFASLIYNFVPADVLSKAYHSMVGPPVLNSSNSVDQRIICVFII